MTCIDCNSSPKAPGRARCWPCYTVYRNKQEAPGLGARTLLIDIETSPNVVYSWGLWNVNVGISQIIESTRMLCFGYKWLGEKQTNVISEWEHGPDLMVDKAWQLLDEADVVMHFNGKRFDIPHLNREMLEAGMLPPSPYRQIDLKNAAKATFRFPSNKLQYISTVLGLDGKDKTDFDLWKDVLAGRTKARKQMEKYNKKDVTLMEELYHILLPWIPQLPNRNLYVPTGGCAACGSTDVKRKGTYKTPLSKYDQYQCSDCGYWMRGTKRISGVGIQAAVL